MTPLSWIVKTLILTTVIFIDMSGSQSQTRVPTVEQLCDTILVQIQACGVQRLLMISDGSEGHMSVNTEIINSLAEAGLLYVHYVIDNRTSNDDVTEILQRHTTNQYVHHATFVLTTPRFDDVIKSAIRYSKDVAFAKSGRLWLHNTRWLIVTSSLQESRPFVSVNNNDIPMDNVAFVTINNHLSRPQNTTTQSSKKPKPAQFHILMWGSDRTRQLSQVSVATKIAPSSINDDNNTNNINTPTENPHTCVIFPNLQYRLNGRHLTTIAKVHWGFFVYTDINPLNGDPEYQGFVIDIIHSLAASLNFTVTVLPYPDPDKQPTWDEVAYNVTSGEVDFSATVWAYSWINVFNICVTYPVILDTVSGAYRKPIPSDEYISLYIMCPFHALTYALLLAALVHTLIIYVIIVELCYSNEDDIIPRNPFNAERRKSKYLQRKFSNPVKPRKKSSDTFVSRLRKLAWSLAASVLNQAYLPRPQQMSARLLLFLWSISMVIFYAIYTGSLTAEMINFSDADKLKDFEELVDGNKYRWGTTQDSIMDKVMENKSHGGIFQTLNYKKENIPDGENGDIYFTIKEKISSLEEDFVLIHFRMILNQIIGTMENPEDYELIHDSLFSANQGLILSKYSELGRLFSEEIQKMHESGLINQMYDKYSHGNRTAAPSTPEDGGTRRKTLTFNNIRWPLIIISILVVISVAVLIVEKLWLPVSRLRSSST